MTSSRCSTWTTVVLPDSAAKRGERESEKQEWVSVEEKLFVIHLSLLTFFIRVCAHRAFSSVCVAFRPLGAGFRYVYISFTECLFTWISPARIIARKSWRTRPSLQKCKKLKLRPAAPADPPDGYQLRMYDTRPCMATEYRDQPLVEWSLHSHRITKAAIIIITTTKSSLCRKIFVISLDSTALFTKAER